MTLLFAIAVLIGFVFWFLATLAVNRAEQIARGCFLVAAVLWFVGRIG